MFKFLFIVITILSIINNVCCDVPATNETVGTSTTNPQATFATKEMLEALQFSNTTVNIIEDYLSNKLPPAALPEGELVLIEVKNKLTYCESLLKSNEDIWQYKVCSSATLRNGISALTTLLVHYQDHKVSSAMSLKPFWYFIWIYLNKFYSF